ncbi:MAG: transposase, partial [Sedimenticola sp.]
MIRLAELITAFLPDLEARYGNRLLPGHRKALSSVLRCRTEESGTAAIHCHDCEAHAAFPLSCGHRFCPQCQHAAGEQWLERQRAKLLPCDYFLITFTLPAQLRTLVYDHQRIAYDLLIKLVWQTLAEFGLNDKKLHGKLGATLVLHTHSRALNFHPHVHIVIPAGAIDTSCNTWRTKSGNFLFPEKALAKVFRGKWFQAMKEQGWKVSETLPMKWVTDCKRVGNGDKALTYLGRYLYRGVLREKDILVCENAKVTFRYTESGGEIRTRTLEGADFLWLLLQHVLPRGFRR